MQLCCRVYVKRCVDACGITLIVVACIRVQYNISKRHVWVEVVTFFAPDASVPPDPGDWKLGSVKAQRSGSGRDSHERKTANAGCVISHSSHLDVTCAVIKLGR